MESNGKEDQQQLTQPAPPGYQQVVGPTQTQPAQATRPLQQPAMQPYPAVMPAAQYVQQPFVQVQSTGYPGMSMVMAPPRPLLPKEMQPNDYLVIALVVTIVCGFFNLTSLFFSVPGIICAVLAYEKKNSGYYSETKNLGLAALILSIITVTWVMVWGVIVTGLVIACAYEVDGFCRYYW